MAKIYSKRYNAYILVDDEDYFALKDYVWQIESIPNSTLKYARAWIPELKKTVKMHTLLMSPPKGMCVDHINGNGLDNRYENLRVCTHLQNLQNRRKIKNTTSRYIGVHWNKKRSTWVAFVSYKDEAKWLGDFKTEHHAAMAYDIWAKELKGEYANLNFSKINP